MTLFHLVPEARWRLTEGRRVYDPDSLSTEGFVHLSTARQVAGTAARFFSGVPDLLLLEVEIPPDDPRLRWEPSAGPRGVEEFPHYHGPLPLAFVTGWSRWRSGAEPLGPES